MFSSVFGRLSFNLVILTCSILAGLDLLGLIPRPTDSRAQNRIQLVEALALQSLVASDRNDFASIRRLLDGSVERTEELTSAGLRSSNGRLLVATKQHQRAWNPDSPEGSTMTHARVPLIRKGKTWATIEVRFEEVPYTGVIASMWARPLVRLLIPVGGIGFIVYMLYLKRSLRHLDPSTVIPTRVQAALNVITEGVVLLDLNARMVLVNTSFADRLGRSPESLLGLKVSELGWLVPTSLKPARDLPWLEALDEGKTRPATPLCMKTDTGNIYTFMVNAAPVGDDDGKTRGVLATFNDITELEQNSRELEHALNMLEKSRDEIRFQNEELQILASCDPLTGVANRRSFMEDGEMEVARAKRQGQQLSCIMIDIDHFKLVNDDHGHKMGDEVLKIFAAELMTQLKHLGLLCRYGGEEFCALIQDSSSEETAALADTLRRTIAATDFAPIPITSSFGVSSLTDGAHALADLLSQADEALYASKHAGRNRVTCWNQLRTSVPAETEGQ
jgi:diguanylate cyclase (GGDEF)-like protein/PAS domain S-box-containing protein